jgi:hypothetical protein
MLQVGTDLRAGAQWQQTGAGPLAIGAILPIGMRTSNVFAVDNYQDY